jgi:DNA repair exonuclease SbcCD ATPase subunit
MNQLKSITYVNAASIPFARVELDGNTLMVGANGAGKTTVLRSALYFYGVHEDSALGINIRKKKGFREYYFGELNSFIGFRYSNAQGNVLVIAYRSANTGVKFKFVVEHEPIDDAELFLENRVARSPEELWKRLRAMEYEVSEVISTLTEYRSILYGQAGAAHRKYAFFETKEDYGNFIHVLSNVFINSKLDASSIQKTISNAIPGFEPIDLEQIERSIASFRGKYDDVTKFEEHRVTVEEILKALAEYESFEAEKAESLDRLLSNEKAFRETSAQLGGEIGKQRGDLEERTALYEEERRTLKERLQELNNEIVILESEIGKAETKLRGYEAQEIEKKVALYDAKSSLEAERSALRKEYDALTDTANSVREKFAALRETEQRRLEQRLQETGRAVLDAGIACQEALEKAGAKEREKTERLEAGAGAKQAELTASRDAAEQTKQEAYEAKVKTENTRFFREELEQAGAQSAQKRKAFEEAGRGVAGHRRALETINETIAAVERERDLALRNLGIPYENSRAAAQEETERLRALLEVGKETFLGFVREVDHPHEGLITALVKDEVLLDATLDPSFSGASDTFFGFSVNRAKLKASDYSRESIEAEMERVAAELAALEKAFQNDRDELENGFRNRLNEQRRLHSGENEALTELEIALPKLEIALAESEEALRELQQRAETAKAEAVTESRAAYEAAVGAYEACAQELTKFRDSLEEEKKTLRREADAEREAAKAERGRRVEALEAQRRNERAEYDARRVRIENDELDALANDGVNSTLLQELTEQIKTLDANLEAAAKVTELVLAYRHDQKEHFEGLEGKKERLGTAKKQHGEQEARSEKLKRDYDAQKKELQRAIDTLEKEQKEIAADLRWMEKHAQENSLFRDMVQGHEAAEIAPTEERLQEIAGRIGTLEQQALSVVDTIRGAQDLLYRDIAPANSLKLAVRSGSDRSNVLYAARDLKEFMDAGKIEQFKEEVSNLFGLTVNQLTKQTESLLEARQEVGKVVHKIRDMLRDLEGISVIDSIDLRTQESSNPVLTRLEQLQKLNDEHALSVERNLFNFDKPKRGGYGEALKIIKGLRKELAATNKRELLLDDTYELEIRASENGNDTGWQVSLDEVGSNGTDVMIKAIVNIAMLAIALGQKRTRKEERQTYFHCILDEIGVLHPSYLKELMAFANEKRIRFLNGAPNRQLVGSFKRIYILTNHQQHTMLKPLLSKQGA